MVTMSVEAIFPYFTCCMLSVKVYRGEFLGTLALVRAPHAQAKKIEKEIWGFPRVPIELLHSALFDRLYGCILLLLDRIQHRPD